MKKIYVSLLLICSLHAVKAEETTTDKINSALESTGKALNAGTEKLNSYLGDSQKRRAESKYFAMLSYSPIDFLIPSKKGATLGMVSNQDKTWELEYLSGNVSVPFIIEDLGKMTDTRYSLIARSYSGSNSFNFSYGITYYDFSLYLGDKLLNSLSGGVYPGVDLVEIQSLGANIAIGNRWVFEKNISFSVDWISWSQPLTTIKKKSAFLDYANNQQDKDDVEKAMNLIAFFPRLAVFKLQLGIYF